MKRFVPVVLLAGTVAFAACGSSGTKSSSSTASGGTSATTASSGGSATTAGSSGGGGTTLQESGSSLMYPYLQSVASGFHSANPSISINPQAGGSGKGVADVTAGTTDFGASDAYLSPTEMSTTPSLVNIPTVVSSQVIDYNLPGVSHLKLSANVISGIYLGQITKWNDSAITALNPGVKLPNLEIHPIHREDSSGDTFLFTTYLTDNKTAFATKIGGPNELPQWPPAPGAASADGNSGMVSACGAQKGCIAYIGISSQPPALKAGLKPAAINNAAGQYVLNTPTTVKAALSHISSIPSNLATSIIFEPGANSYPIINFEYIVVKKGSKNVSDVKTFLSWLTSPTGGSASKYLSPLGFQALPSAVSSKAAAAIAGL